MCKRHFLCILQHFFSNSLSSCGGVIEVFSLREQAQFRVSLPPVPALRPPAVAPLAVGAEKARARGSGTVRVDSASEAFLCFVSFESLCAMRQDRFSTAQEDGAAA